MVRRTFSHSLNIAKSASMEFFTGISTLNVVFNQLTSMNYAICKITAEKLGKECTTKADFKPLHTTSYKAYLHSLQTKGILESSDSADDFDEFLKEQLQTDAGNKSGRMSFGHISATGLRTANAAQFRNFILNTLSEEVVNKWCKMIENMEKFSSTSWIYDKLVDTNTVNEEPLIFNNFDWYGDSEPEWYS